MNGKRKTKPAYKPKRKPAFKTKAKKNVIPKQIVSLGNGLPTKLMASLKWREYIALTSTSGVLTNYYFSCNNMQKPNINSGTHQPMYFDQYMSMYNHFHVIGSKCKVTFLNSGSGGTAAAVGIYLNDDASSTGLTTYDAYSEQTKCRVKIMGIGATDDREILTQKYSAKKVYGGSVLSNNALRGNSTTAPAEQTTYNLFLQSLDKLTTTTVYVWVEIEYLAIFTELKDFAQS